MNPVLAEDLVFFAALEDELQLLLVQAESADCAARLLCPDGLLAENHLPKSMTQGEPSGRIMMLEGLTSR